MEEEEERRRLQRRTHPLRVLEKIGLTNCTYKPFFYFNEAKAEIYLLQQSNRGLEKKKSHMSTRRPRG
jgi:hypothetical protein